MYKEWAFQTCTTSMNTKGDILKTVQAAHLLYIQGDAVRSLIMTKKTMKSGICDLCWQFI